MWEIVEYHIRYPRMLGQIFLKDALTLIKLDIFGVFDYRLSIKR